MNIEETIEKNMGLVKKMASRLYVKNTIYNIDDLVQVGLLNLLTSLPKYNPERARLSTFISHCVKNSMVKFIKKNYDSNKVNTDAFESIPNCKSMFFEGNIVHGNNLFYYDDQSIEEYFKDNDSDIKQIIKLKMNGKSQRQIKEETGISENKIKQTLNKIKEELIGNI